MNKTWNGKTLREILRFSSAAEFFEWMPWTLVDAIAFFSLAAFCLFPVVIAIPTLVHCSFDQMVMDSMGLLDGIIFPLVTVNSALAYVLTLGKMRHEKRSPLAAVRKSPTLILFAALMAWMCVNLFFVNRVEGAFFHGLLLRHESFSLNLEYYLGFFALGMALRNPRLKLWLLRGLAAVSALLVPCAFYLWKNLTASPIYYDWQPMFTAIFTHWNYYGYFLSVAVGVCAGLFAAAEKERPRWRAFYALALIINTVGLSYTTTRGAWIASFCACLFLVAAYRVRDGKFQRRSLIALGIFALAFFPATLFGNPESLGHLQSLPREAGLVISQPRSEEAAFAGSGRWQIWARCLNIIRQYPLMGIGFEGIYLYDLGSYVTATRPHNEFIQYALFYGIPAALLYIAGCVSVYWRAVKRRARLDNLTLTALTAAFAYLVSSFFGVSVYNTAPFLFIMLGLGYVHDDARAIPADNDAETLPADADAETLPADADAETLPADADAETLSADNDAETLPADAEVSAPDNETPPLP